MWGMRQALYPAILPLVCTRRGWRVPRTIKHKRAAGRIGICMAETPDRYCGNCGRELSPEDQFCRNCGRPVHQAARVPTPEADVPVPPPPQREQGIAASPTHQDQSTDVKEWWQNPIGRTIGIIVAIITVLVILANLAGGEGTGSQANNAKQQQGA
jgi:hypothetical protein